MSSEARGTDDGETFEQRTEGLPNTDVHALGAGGGVLFISYLVGLGPQAEPQRRRQADLDRIEPLA